MKMLSLFVLIFPSLVFAKKLPDLVLADETVQASLNVDGSIRRDILSAVPGGILKGKVWVTGSSLYGEESPIGIHEDLSGCQTSERKRNVAEIPCSIVLNWNFSQAGTTKVQVLVYIQSEGGPEDMWTGDLLIVTKTFIFVAGGGGGGNNPVPQPSPTPPSVPTPEPPNPNKPYPISSNYPGQCSAGVISDRLSGFSVVSLSTRTFTEEIPIPGLPFTLVYNSGHFVVGGPRFPQDHVVGGWVYSIDSFYDRKKNTVFYGDGTVQVLAQIPNLERNGKFALMDVSGRTYTVYTAVDGKFYFRKSELNNVTLLNSLDWNDDKSFAGFADAFERQYIRSKDGKHIVGPTSEILATLSYFPNGKLESVTLPNGARYELTYNNEGRLNSFKRPLGKTSYFEYDSEGYLLKDSSNAGRSIVLQSNFDSTNRQLHVVSLTGAGAKKSTLVTANGNVTYRAGSSDFGGQSVAVSTLSNGLNQVWDLYGGYTETQMTNSPKWGWEVKYASQETFKAGSILLKKQEEQRKNGEVLVKTIILQGDQKRKYESYTVSKPGTYGSFVTTPMNRRYTQTLNEKGQPTMQIISKDGQTVWAEAFTYDTAGNLTSHKNTEGTVVASYGYGANRLLEKITDAIGNSTGLSYDNMRRLSKIQYSTGSSVEFIYDLEGNLTGIKPPGKPFHNFNYKLGDLVSSYVPPVVSQTDSGVEYRYDSEERISEVLIGGNLASSYKYGSNESRLFEVKNSHTTVGITYAENSNKKPTDLVSSLTTSDGVKTNYSYLWKLPTAVDTQGPVSSSVRYKYNTDATLAGIDVAGVDGKFFSYALSYDLDGLPVKVGNISFVLDTVGRVQASTQGVVKGQVQYNLNGYVTGEAYSANGKGITNIAYSRDAIGRVSAASFTSPSQKINYSYDKLGRLVSAQSANGSREYIYDENGNRLEFRSGTVVLKGEYDDQDRLISYGQNQYTYSKFGNLSKVEEYSSPSQKPRVTEYDYDSFGNLRSVKLPDGRFIEYIIDGQNRRIGKKVNGKLVQGFIFQSQYQIAAETDGTGKIVRRFIYGSKINIPDYVATGGKEYRIISDQVGTPKLIVEAATGKIVESLNYDEFGVSFDGKHSAYLPFGFAGGVNDRDTGLVRFGARDYNPQTGRWTNRDPILFNGGDTNLYGYVLQDPINYIDPSGKSWEDVNWRNVAGGLLNFGGGIALLALMPANPVLAIPGGVIGAAGVITGAGLLAIEYNNLITGSSASVVPQVSLAAEAGKCP
ncbi:RHS repeat domain-containing protein [Bdellovibrio bacteriovorus]|uniref:RHS repeat domain-containing protein n=1 Tax=Bdellovibrio TaxID=958 RepID=UPI0035A822B9